MLEDRAVCRRRTAVAKAKEALHGEIPVGRDPGQLSAALLDFPYLLMTQLSELSCSQVPSCQKELLDTGTSISRYELRCKLCQECQRADAVEMDGEQRRW